MALTQDDLKRAVAQAAIAYVPNDCIVGVGTGSTANFFIDELAKIKHKIRGAVASSEASAKRLQGHGIEVLSLNDAGDLPVYVDGADEITRHMHMLKGGGGALTREKIVAAASKKFICVCDASKLVDVLGKFPLPIEVIPMARSYVARELVKLGGQPQVARGFYHRQRQCHSGRAQSADHESGGTGNHVEPIGGRGDQRFVRAPCGGCAAARHAGRREDAHSHDSGVTKL